MDERLEREMLEQVAMQGRLAAGFHRALSESGVAPVDALSMTCAWISAFVGRPPQPMPPARGEL